MRRREVQSFQLKLSDLKEYEIERQKMIEKRTQDAMTTPITGPAPIVKVGPKPKQEVRDRIGMKNWGVWVLQLAIITNTLFNW